MSLLRQQPELLVATPDWRRSSHVPTVIDIEDFMAKIDQSWISFCEQADAYTAACGTINPIKDSPG